MASITHIAVGMAAGRLWAGGRGATAREAASAMVIFTSLSMLPDADVIAFILGIPYADPFGHRGASHSLGFAALMGAAAAALALAKGGRPIRDALFTAAVVASHPLLDALTDGGLGVALWWPASDARIFFPWRPIPVAPIGAAFFTPRGLSVALAELGPSLPLLLYSLWRPREVPG